MGLELLIIISIVIIFYLSVKECKKQGLHSRPSSEEAAKLSKEIIQNKEYFSDRTYYEAREKMDWLDPVTYEDIRNLSIKNNLNYESIQKVFY